MHPLDRLLPRATIALVVFLLVSALLGVLLNGLSEADRRGAQTECRARGGQVVLLDGEAWRCVPEEGR